MSWTVAALLAVIAILIVVAVGMWARIKELEGAVERLVRLIDRNEFRNNRVVDMLLRRMLEKRTLTTTTIDSKGLVITQERFTS